MIRLTLLSLFLTVLVIYSWKDWYQSLCGLVVLMAFIEHPDMPKSIFGIQGLNPWNLCFFFIALAWIMTRNRDGFSWDMPKRVSLLLLAYFAVVLVGFFRLYLGGGLAKIYSGESWGLSPGSAFSEYIVNSVKWVLPGILMYDGCRNRSRLYWGLFSILAVYVLLSVQVIKWMPLSEITSGDSLSRRSLKILLNEIGYHRVNLSMMLAGASWAILSIWVLAKNTAQSLLVVLSTSVVVFAQALTGGRAGYGTWCVVGLILCAARWRKLLLLAPIFVLVVVALVPSVTERMLMGFTPETRDRNRMIQETMITDSDSGPDMYTVLAGRNFAWPFVVDKIAENPWLGYGRMAMWTTGITFELFTKLGESFPHPHNAYLELLLDSGLIGFFFVMWFYCHVLRKSFSLFLTGGDPMQIAVGGVSLALLLALLVASFGSQSFYPREGSVGMWCAIGLMLRVDMERARTGKAQEQDHGSHDLCPEGA